MFARLSSVRPPGRTADFGIKSSSVALGGIPREPLGEPLLQAWGSHEDSRIRDPREYRYQFAARADGEQAAIQVMAAAAASAEEDGVRGIRSAYTLITLFSSGRVRGMRPGAGRPEAGRPEVVPRVCLWRSRASLQPWRPGSSFVRGPSPEFALKGPRTMEVTWRMGVARGGLGGGI